MTIIYFIITCFATLIGALSGLGGGVIIKPILDAFAFHDLRNISFLSSCAVLCMAVYSIGKHVRMGTKFDFKTIGFISVGSIAGGKVGNAFFHTLLAILPEVTVKRSQSLLLAGLLVVVLFIVKRGIAFKPIKNPMSMVIVGLSLGTLSSFLGIGGGPINVAVYMLFFGVSIKTASVFSIATILFAQASNLAIVGYTTHFVNYDTRFLWIMLPSALIGSNIGTLLNKKFTDQQICRVFNWAVTCLIVLNTYNALFPHL